MTATTLALLLWAFQYAGVGQSKTSVDSLVGLSLLFIVLFCCLVSALVGALIDGRRGALWGGFLGPIGWVIASIRRLERRVQTKSPIDGNGEIDIGHLEPQAEGPPPFDMKKWAILKEVDADIKTASDRVSAADPLLDAVLAEKYLCLSEKSYLEPLVAKLLSEAGPTSSARVGGSLEIQPGLYEVSGLFRIRIMPDNSVLVLSGPSGELPVYEHFSSLDDFLKAHRTSGVNAGLLKVLD